MMYVCDMKNISNENTKIKIKLGDIAEIQSGVYAKASPTGTIAFLQVKDLLLNSPDITAARIESVPKLENYLLRKGDLLFAGKGTTYLCNVFDYDIKAVPSTTLYYIRLRSDLVTPSYLGWYLNHPSVVASVKTVQVGSGTPLIHKSTLENLEVIVPDKTTQQRIVELSQLQKREEYLLKQIAQKRVQVLDQILINELNK